MENGRVTGTAMADQGDSNTPRSRGLIPSEFKTVVITLVAGVISAIATIGAAYLGGFFDVAKTNAVSLGTMNLERLKFSNELVKNALSTNNSANSLLFYADIGLLDGLKLDKVRDYAQRESDRLKQGDTGTSLLPSFDKGARPKLWLNRDLLLAIAPKAAPAYIDALVSTGNYLLLGFGISANPKRLACFLAQIDWETAGFTTMVENASYSKGKLLETWPSKFNEQNVDQYADKPEKILALVYANKMGNGPETSGDGWKYRGRGFLQITGRDNYERFSKETGVDLISNPDSMGDPNISLLITALYWYNNGVNAFADEGDMGGVSRKIDGAPVGSPEKMRLYSAILTRFSNQNK
jgi:putative chitinase